jgi:hypothetical protein
MTAAKQHDALVLKLKGFDAAARAQGRGVVMMPGEKKAKASELQGEAKASFIRQAPRQLRRWS